MSVKRIVSTGFWTDRKVADAFSPEDKYFMLYLLTNPHTTQLGIYELSISTAASELGYAKEAVMVLLDRFERKYEIIKWNRDTGEVAIKNYLRHSILKGGKPVFDCLMKEALAVSDKELLYYISEELSKYENLNQTVRDFLEALPKRETEKVAKRKTENNINTMTMTMNESYHESYSESYHESSKPKKAAGTNIPPTIEEVREYIKSIGSPVDADEFYNYYGSVGWMRGKNKMKNWHMAISTWEQKRGFKRSEIKEDNTVAIKQVPVIETPISDDDWEAGGDNV